MSLHFFFIAAREPAQAARPSSGPSGHLLPGGEGKCAQPPAGVPKMAGRRVASPSPPGRGVGERVRGEAVVGQPARTSRPSSGPSGYPGSGPGHALLPGGEGKCRRPHVER